MLFRLCIKDLIYSTVPVKWNPIVIEDFHCRCAVLGVPWMILIPRECTKNRTKCKIRRVLSELDSFCCSNGILARSLIVPMIENDS